MSQSNENHRKLPEPNKIVVKIGTDCLTNEDSELDISKLDKLVSDFTTLLNEEKEGVLVSSGAIGAGIGKLSLEEKPEEMEPLQAASTIGQGELMRRYSESFEKYDRQVAQLLLTQQDFTNPTRFGNLKNTIKELLDWDITPIINENDAVAVEEIRMGDNDLLSAFTASAIKADLLIILTDVDGLYEKNPKKNSDANRIKKVEKVDEEILDLTRETSEGNFGGMQTKIEAAKIATEEGIPVVITKASKENIIEKVIEGKEMGTLFLPQEKYKEK